MTIEQLTTIIAGLSRDEVLVLVEALQARLGLRDGPDDWGGFGAIYGGPPHEHSASTLREVGGP